LAEKMVAVMRTDGDEGKPNSAADGANDENKNQEQTEG